MTDLKLEEILNGEEFAFVKYGKEEDLDNGYETYGVLVKDSAGDYYIAGAVSRNRMQVSEFDFNFSPKKVYENDLENLTKIEKDTYMHNLSFVPKPKIDATFTGEDAAISDLKENDLVYIKGIRPVIGRLQQKRGNDIYLSEPIRLASQGSAKIEKIDAGLFSGEYIKVSQAQECRYIALKALL